MIIAPQHSNLEQPWFVNGIFDGHCKRIMAVRFICHSGQCITSARPLTSAGLKETAANMMQNLFIVSIFSLLIQING